MPSALTIPAVLAAAAAAVPETLAVIDGQRRISYAVLAADVDRAAAALIGTGIEHGDRVALWAPNSYEFVVAALAVTSIGTVLVPLNTRYRGEEARDILDRSGARLLVVADGFLGTDYLAMLGVRPEHREITDGYDTDSDGHSTGSAGQSPALPGVQIVTTDPAGWEQFLARGATVSPAQLASRRAAVQPDDLADVMYTSGTTGRPKGAMLTHANNVLTNAAWAHGVGLSEGDTYLLVNPLFHSFGYRAGLLACLAVRATACLMATFDPVACLETIEREQITAFPAAPTVYVTLLDHPERARFDTSSLRLVVTGAAMVPVPLIERIRDDLGVDVVITAYGLTESCGTATVTPPDAPTDKISTTCGLPIPGVELAVVAVTGDSPGTRLPPGEPGEVLIRGSNVMRGYLDDPVATAAAIDADGWLHTGDVGFVDAQGYLTITDRLKAMFTTGGFNVYPAEIERVLLTHPGVADVAVVGTPDARLGEVGHAYAVARPGAAPSADDLIGYCRERLANFKVPRHLTFVDALPRNPSGKVQKFLLTASDPADATDPPNPASRHT